MVLVIVIFMKRFSLWEFLIPYSQNLKIWLDWILLKWVTNCATNCVTIATFASNGVHLEHIWRLRRVLHRVLQSAQSTSDVCATFKLKLQSDSPDLPPPSSSLPMQWRWNIFKGTLWDKNLNENNSETFFGNRHFWDLAFLVSNYFQIYVRRFCIVSGFTCWLVEYSRKITEELFPKLGSSQIIPKRIPSSNTFPLQLYLGHLPPRLRLSIGREKGKCLKMKDFVLYQTNIARVCNCPDITILVSHEIGSWGRYH